MRIKRYNEVNENLSQDLKDVFSFKQFINEFKTTLKNNDKIVGILNKNGKLNIQNTDLFGDGKYLMDINIRKKDIPSELYNESSDNSGGFHEITFTLVHDDGKEVMFNILSNGKVIGIYCYADGIPVYYNEHRDIDVVFSTKEGKNPLFRHINVNKSNILKLLLYCGGTPSIETDEEFDILMNMIKQYKLESYGIDNDWGEY